MSKTASMTTTMEHLTLRPDQNSTASPATLRRRSSLVPSLSFPKSYTLQEPKSPFLKLPAEIRNVIYTDLFQDQEARIRPDYTLPGLLTSCKQLYTEAIGLYYNLTTFRCLDETSTISWLIHLPRPFLDLVPEVRYDTRWIVFVTPMIPVSGVEGWLFQGLVAKLKEGGFDVHQLGQKVGEDGEVVGEGKLKISYYGRGSGASGVEWTDRPGLIEEVRRVGRV
ncbi:hypothetical protein CLAFUW4_12211 [Fulvia fulva]|uniref:Uncharacterized protein n=1 Tax=Passalora fulva TaxID=5499 RepID=A0A9Q8PE15_PASFU|nr:uncharacterized protein CLAFUR5_11242 [Fulvia fulva]KAK4618035.1 hypothetical protein CLAFUR4_12216 [Fulvia fulva]KAK4618419.1 hypothetical protein CLAFUR0_12227 [Fulvia fulva]UJO20849.1 hypothetical protein CLAFUR5_11242 [Fulvia fulva]WPV18711.1 hypothetical protein CLAFUW4_12211 [Fulvia fulva]WPV32903.1 hypothetical protein CLAFUW7_12218 [Fulvia fulva]